MCLPHILFTTKSVFLKDSYIDYKCIQDLTLEPVTSPVLTRGV